MKFKTSIISKASEKARDQRYSAVNRGTKLCLPGPGAKQHNET